MIEFADPADVDLDALTGWVGRRVPDGWLDAGRDENYGMPVAVCGYKTSIEGASGATVELVSWSLEAPAKVIRTADGARVDTLSVPPDAG